MHLNAALRNAGLWILLSLASGHLTEQQASDIVDIHNDIRSEVQPSAAFMHKVVWNETVHLVAESYAAKCIFKDNPDLPNLKMGENRFVTNRPFNVIEVMLDWLEENSDYDFDSNSCNKICHHYTQMVWATSTQIGCAAHLCQTIEGLDYKNATLLVCNYYPRGNYKGRRPYEQGRFCSKCPDDLCEGNICVKHLPSGEPEYDATEPTIPPDTAQESTAVTEEDTTEDTKIWKVTTSRSEVERSSVPEDTTEVTETRKVTTSRSEVERSSAPEDTMEDTKIRKVTTSRSEVERSSAPLLMGVWILAALIL